jgi:conjugal transfer/entry exclusion protein
MSGLPRRGIGFLQPVRALVAAHLNCFAADRDSDGARIELAIARRTRFFNHDLDLQ